MVYEGKKGMNKYIRKKGVCVLGQKSFQLEYSKLLEDKKVALSIGKPIEQKSDYLIYKIHELIKNNNTFSKNAFFFVKPGGLARISDIIIPFFTL